MLYQTFKYDVIFSLHGEDSFSKKKLLDLQIFDCSGYFLIISCIDFYV